jgi:hypothetical protein
MHSEKSDIIQKEKQEEFLNKLNFIEINKQYDCIENYSKKLKYKFPLLKDYIILSEENSKKHIKNSFDNKTSTNKQKIAIVYHVPCFDGSYSAVNAFIHYKYFSNKINTIHFFPMTNSQRLDEILELEMLDEYNKIYFFDKGFNYEDFQFLYDSISNYNIKNNVDRNKLIIIDHHISSIEIFMKDFCAKFNSIENVAIIFDKEEKRSACGITYEFFHAKALRKLKCLVNKKASNFSEIYENYQKYFSDEYKKVKYFELRKILIIII